MATQRSPEQVLQFAKENGARMLDLRFADLPGLWQHVTFPIAQLTEDKFQEGFGFDGSSIRGWQAISESDMLIVPDPNTAMMDPFTDVPTLVMITDIADPITKQHYERDPRWIATKAEQYLKYSGIGDIAYFGAEAEFFTTTVSITSTPRKAAGTPAARRTTSATGPVTRKAISPFLRPTTTKTSAPKWSPPCRSADSRSSATTTRLPAADKGRSIKNTIRSSMPPTT